MFQVILQYVFILFIFNLEAAHLSWYEMFYCYTGTYISIVNAELLKKIKIKKLSKWIEKAFSNV